MILFLSGGAVRAWLRQSLWLNFEPKVSKFAQITPRRRVSSFVRFAHYCKAEQFLLIFLHSLLSFRTSFLLCKVTTWEVEIIRSSWLAVHFANARDKPNHPCRGASTKSQISDLPPNRTRPKLWVKKIDFLVFIEHFVNLLFLLWAFSGSIS